MSVVVVAVIALLAHLCASFGLFALAPEWMTPLLIGAIAASASGAAWKPATAGTAVGSILSVAAARPWFLGNTTTGSGGFAVQAGIFVLLGAAAAGAVAYLSGKAARRERAEWIVAVTLVAAIVGAMAVTTWAVDSGSFAKGAESLGGVLAVRPELGDTLEDHDYFMRLFYDTHDGQPYYDSYAELFLADSNGGNRLPAGAPGYRLPTIFYIWLLLPPNGETIPWAFLVFASLAVASSFSIGAQLARPGPAVLGALMVAVAYLLLATTTWVTFVDGWAMALTLGGVALLIAATRRGSRGLLFASVGVLLAGAAMREILVYPMLLAAVSVFLLPRERRWSEAWPWLVGLAAFAVMYATHVVAIAGRVSAESGYAFWLRGGVDHLWATLRFFDPYFGGRPWLVPILVAIGLVGAVLTRGIQSRLSAFLTVAVAAPLVSFLVLGNGGLELATGAPAGYWGILVVPIALALVPVAMDRTLAALGVAPAKALAP